MPFECACCGATPDATLGVTATRTTGKRIVRTQSKSQQVPYCQQCLAHAAAMPTPWGVGAVFMCIVTCLLWIPVQLWIDSMQRRRAQELSKPECSVLNLAAAYLGWSGSVHEFVFARREFALTFILQNRKNVVNLPYEVLADLERHAHLLCSRKQAERPLNAVPHTAQGAAAGDDVAIATVVAKLEKLKTLVARRAALETALSGISSSSAKEKLVLLAAKLEVDCVMDKVDGLKSPSAKRRHLTAALDQLRTDVVADALQQREIALLESALQELDNER